MNFSFPLSLALYIGVAVSLSYLIYRYMRYSRWEETDAGRAFLGMKVCLLALTLFGLLARAFPESDLRDPVRTVIVGGILVAVLYQVRVMVRRQGGFRRNRPVQRWVPYGDKPRYERRSDSRNPTPPEGTPERRIDRGRC